MKTRLLVVLVVAAVGSAVAGAPAWATPLDFSISGEISQIDDPDGILGGQFTLGMPFTGSFGYDSDLEDLDSDPTLGRYLANPAMGQIELSMQVGGESFRSNPQARANLVIRDLPTDLLVLNSPSSIISTGLPISQLELLLRDSDGTAISGDSPPTSLVLADWDDRALMSFAYLRRGRLALVFGEIQSLTPVTVPEPSTGLLVALGTLGCTLSRRR